MKRFISFLFALMCFSASAQFKPLPPTGSVVFGTTNYLAPDSSIWLGSPSKGFTPVVIGNAVKSVTGDLVNLTDSVNPVVNLPGWVNQLRADRVGGLNISEGGSYLLGSSYTDATMLLAGQGTNFNTYTLKFPKLNGVTYKRHMVIFNVNIDSIILESVDNAKIKEVPTKAKVNDIWTLTYDSFSNSWNLEAINSMPKWYIDSKVSKDDLSMIPVSGKVPVFSEQGLLSTGPPLFPENAVPLSILDIRIPLPPQTGNFVLKSVNGVASWVEE